jgi:hypothetical protein
VTPPNCVNGANPRLEEDGMVSVTVRACRRHRQQLLIGGMNSHEASEAARVADSPVRAFPASKDQRGTRLAHCRIGAVQDGLNEAADAVETTLCLLADRLRSMPGWTISTGGR